jgi:hypothetical protein
MASDVAMTRAHELCRTSAMLVAEITATASNSVADPGPANPWIPFVDRVVPESARYCLENGAKDPTPSRRLNPRSATPNDWSPLRSLPDA